MISSMLLWFNSFFSSWSSLGNFKVNFGEACSFGVTNEKLLSVLLALDLTVFGELNELSSLLDSIYNFTSSILNSWVFCSLSMFSLFVGEDAGSLVGELVLDGETFKLLNSRKSLCKKWTWIIVIIKKNVGVKSSLNKIQASWP